MSSLLLFFIQSLLMWTRNSWICEYNQSDAPELEEILADAPRVMKGKAKAVETVVEDDEVSEDEDAALNWGA